VFESALPKFRLAFSRLNRNNVWAFQLSSVFCQKAEKATRLIMLMQPPSDRPVSAHGIPISGGNCEALNPRQAAYQAAMCVA